MLRAHLRALTKGIGPVFAWVTSHAYLRWLLTQGIRHPKLRREAAPGWLLGHRELFAQRAPGRTCVSALAAMPEFGAPADNDSKGCGTVMRVAPIGLYFAHQDDAAPGFDAMVFEAGVEDAALTHGHPTGQLAAGFLALTIARVARGHELDVAIARARAELLRHARHEETLAAVDLAVALAHSSPDDPAAIARLGGGWVAEEALAIALYCSLAAPDFETGVTRAVNHGGDSDSTGAIAGNLLGARLGEGAIPERWLRELELREVVGEVAEDLAACAEWEVDTYDETGEGEFYWGRYPGW
jgi:ADP-ribosylglycohydrolase